MKLHLPKGLLVAVLAAFAMGQTAWGESIQWKTPTYGGPEYTWTGAAGDNRYETDNNWKGNSKPTRSNNKGPLLLFDNVTATVSGGGGVDTSDSGGIKVTGNSSVTCTLGRWAGAIYVEEGSALTTSYSQQLKDDYSDDSTANVYVGGTLTITNTDSLNLNDGAPNQKWIIDTYGSINLSQASSVSKNGTWALQYWKVNNTNYEGEALNRSLESVTINQTLIDSSFDLSTAVDSVTVVDKTTGNAVSADSYTLTYGTEGDLSISYEAQKYTAASLQASGDITWAHGTSGWTVQSGDETDTTFLNGDTVHFAGNGTASLSGDVSVADLTVADGVDYTVAMQANSSLTIDQIQDNFGSELAISGDETTSLHLNMSTNAEGDGDSRIMLKEGSSVGAVYATGVVAYNVNLAGVTSNLGGADLHIANNGVLLLRNGLSGAVDANIGDIYFDGNEGLLRVYGSVTNTVINNNITAAGTLRKTDGGTVSLNGTVSASCIIAKGGTLELGGTTTTTQLMAGGGNITIDGTVTAAQLRLKEQGNGTVTVSSGGILNITGAENGYNTNASLLMSHWDTWYGGHNTTGLIIDGGDLNATGAVLKTGWSSAGFFKVLNGTANIKGICFWGQSNKMFGLVELGKDDGDGSARLNIGSGGIINFAGDATLRLSNGILGATADWELAHNPAFTASQINLTGSGTGTVVDTTDAVDKTTARHITFKNALTGSGKLVVDGKGSLTLMVAGDNTGDVTINSEATLKLQSGGEYTMTHNVTGAGTLQVESGTTLLNNSKSIASKLVLNGGNATLSGTTTADGDITVKNGSTLSFDGGDVLDYDETVTWRVETGGTIDYGSSRQAFGNGSTLELAGGRVTGTGDGYGALDMKDNATVTIHTTADSDMDATVRLRNGANIKFEVDKDKTLSFGGVLKNRGTETDKTYGGSGGGFSKTGEGTMKITSANIYSGTTTVSEGVLETANAAALGTGKVSLEGGILKLAAALSVSAMDYVSESSQVQLQANSLEVTGTLSVGENVGMQITGSGATTVNTLQLNAGASISTEGALSMTNLSMGKGSSMAANETINLNGTLTLGSGIKLTGSLLTKDALDALGTGEKLEIFSGITQLNFMQTDGATRSSSATVAYTEPVDFNDVFSVEGVDDGMYELTFSDGSLWASQMNIPEPATATLSLLALAGLAMRRRRR